MLNESDFASLNPAQSEAVNTLKGPLLVIAGAGSGKTRILTFRIAHLISSGAAMPGEIWAVTFTNKAAKEMKARVGKLVEGTGIHADDIWVSTFHSSGAKLLRMYGDRLGLEPGFSIFDDSDSQTLLKQCFQELGISDKVLAPKQVHYRIQAMKNEGEDPATFKAGPGDWMEKKMEPVFHAYERALRRNNAVDFGDLLFKTLQLFQTCPDILEKFQDRYQFLLVDEYQDTNAVQYKLLKLVASKYRNICVVGDEDQSIYKWRGADIRNILDFEEDYEEAKVVKLEENYRSSANIISASNHVISNNTQRKAKELFTNNDKGKPVEVHVLESDFEEARWVAEQIQAKLDADVTPDEVAIFYRTHAQSRLLEDALRGKRIQYKIYGGLKFYDRAEVKDAIAYMKLLSNPKDDVALRRIINVPARSIGKASVEKLGQFALEANLSLMGALNAIQSGDLTIPTALAKKLLPFARLMKSLQGSISEMSLRDFYSHVLEETGYIKALEAQDDVESATRLENLQELASAIADYETRVENPTLDGFLEEVALYTDQDREGDEGPCVTMMTMHSAKGLEYPYVYLVGLEEELFPSIRGDAFAADPDEIEEERRLCYVGMTRAERELYLTSAHVRRVFGVRKIRRLSRFVDELPQEEVVITDHQPSRVSSGGGFSGRGNFDDYGYEAPGGDDFAEFFEDSSAKDDQFSVGVKVKHPDYGQGVVIARQGNSDDLKLSIRFDQSGTKKFKAKYAPLEVLL